MSYSNDDCWYKEVCTVECSVHCPRYLEMSSLMQNSNIPKARQIPSKLQPYQQDTSAFMRLAEIKSSIVDFVDHGENLYIMGRNTGNGKTSWAIKLMLKFFDEVWAGNGFRPRGLFIHVPTFLLKCKDFNNRDKEFEELKKLIPVVDLVIWDDIASTDVSSYDYSQLLMNIDARCLNMKANIYTGNIVSRDELNRSLGSKLTSRIWGDSTEVIEIKGGDRR